MMDFFTHGFKNGKNGETAALALLWLAFAGRWATTRFIGIGIADIVAIGLIRWLRVRRVLLLLILLGIAVPPAQAAQADTIHIERASLEADATGWRLNARFAFELNSSLEEAVNKGIPLYFTTEFELVQPRWYWLNKRVVIASQSIRLSYQPLMREYRISSGGLQLGLPTLKETLAVIKHVTSWHVIPAHSVKSGKSYTASVRMYLDTALMPKPFQINAVNNRDWNLASDWKHFIFTATSASPHSH